jgi:hypothetical protein
VLLELEIFAFVRELPPSSGRFGILMRLKLVGF